jgi:hypothetical protein
MYNMRVCCTSIFNEDAVRLTIWTQESLEELAIANYPGLKEAGPPVVEEVVSQLEHCVSMAVRALPLFD